MRIWLVQIDERGSPAAVRRGVLAGDCSAHGFTLANVLGSLCRRNVGLARDADDREIVEVASQEKLILVTNNRRDFRPLVKERIAATSKKRNGCTQVHGLVIVLPSDKFTQHRALHRAAGQLQLDGRAIGWKEVRDLCLEVVIGEAGKPRVRRLPRCPHCEFSDVKKPG